MFRKHAVLAQMWHLSFALSIIVACFMMVQVISLAQRRLTFRPSSSVRLDGIFQSYPPTLWRTLFSSVPKREFALQNVTLEVCSELVLLLGASSSGKSTILRLVSGQESPVAGTLTLNPPGVEPVYLDRKPPFDDSSTVQTLLVRDFGTPRLEGGVLQALVQETCRVVGLLDREQQLKPSQLSPSEVFRYGLARACIQSVALTIENKTLEEVFQEGVACPILLLDEWMDFETSSTVHRVEESLLKLGEETGAAILCVTHKPGLFAKKHRSITLNGGKILYTGGPLS